MNKSKWGIPMMPHTICAIDASTNNFAFALFDTQQKELGFVGKIQFEGNDIYEKVMDAGKKISKEEQLANRTANPGKSVSWYKAYERNLRKERTIKFINTIYDRHIVDNDVADACGIGHWAMSNWTKAIGVDK